MTTLASLVHGNDMSRDAALALMSGGRAPRRRFTPAGEVVVAPVRPRASVADQRFWAIGSATVPGDPDAIRAAFARAGVAVSWADDSRMEDLIGQ